MALKADGTVWARSDNHWGQSGIGPVPFSSVPLRVRGQGGMAFLTGVTDIAAGEAHSLALTATHTVFAWGFNGVGQLGDGTTTNRRFPVPLSSLSGIIAVAAGAQ